MSAYSCYHPVEILVRTGRDYHKSSRLVPCGKCVACKARKRSDWFIRLLSEYLNSENAVFFTLTYDDDHIPKDHSVSRKDLWHFIRRLKQSQKQPLRYFCVSEYGDNTFRPHYHGILFNIDLNFDNIDSFHKYLQSKWKLGFVTTSRVTFRRLNYVVKYCVKSNLIEGRTKPFLCCNHKPAIGECFLTRQMVNFIKNEKKTLIQYHGYIRPLPKFYRKRIFDAYDNKFIQEKLQDLRYNKTLDELKALRLDFDINNIDRYVKLKNASIEEEERIRKKLSKKSKI